METLPRFDMGGTVVDATPDLSEERFSKLASLAERWSKQAEQAFEQELGDMMSPERPAPNVTVTAICGWTKRTTVTYANGEYGFPTLPAGTYEVLAEGQPRTVQSGGCRTATDWRRIESQREGNAVHLVLRGDRITVSGRIADVQGRPIAGAKVRGLPDPMPETSEGGRDNPWKPTVSADDGSYELKGIAPPPMDRVAGFLRGGDPTRGGEGTPPFFVDLRVQANGFAEGKARVPIVTGELAAAGRRFLKILYTIDPRSKSGEREKDGPVLPAGTHNTITGIDLVLEEAASERK